MRRREDARRGLTLVEVVVAMAVGLLLAGGAMSMMAAALGGISRSEKLSAAHVEAMAAMQTLEHEVRNADSMTILPGKPPTDAMDGGKLYVNVRADGTGLEESTKIGGSRTIFAGRGDTLTVNFSDSAPTTLHVSVVVAQNGVPVYRASTDILLQNLRPDPDGDATPIEDSAGGPGGCIAFRNAAP